MWYFVWVIGDFGGAASQSEEVKHLLVLPASESGVSSLKQVLFWGVLVQSQLIWAKNLTCSLERATGTGACA